MTSIFSAVNTSAGSNDVDGGNCILGSETGGGAMLARRDVRLGTVGGETSPG